MNLYKKRANTKRNEWLRSTRRKKPIHDDLVMDTWVGLPISEDGVTGDLNAEPVVEVELRKQEADATNDFLKEFNQLIRYEKKSDWAKQKWRNKSKDNG